MQAFLQIIIYLYLDIMIISEKDIDFKDGLGYSKVKTVHVYVWAGLTIIFSFEKGFKS